MVNFVLLVLLTFPISEQKHYVATAQAFGAVGDGKHDDTEAVQKAIYWAIRNRAKCQLYGTLAIKRTIHIGSHEGCKYAIQFTIDMDGGTALNATGNCLVWRGPNNVPMVECNQIQRSHIKLNLVNPDDHLSSAKGNTGFYWHNANGNVKSSNINEVSLNLCGFETGLQLGDFSNDGWHSNIDDNLFPKLVFSQCRHSLLIDSVAQDNNVIGYFHGGAADKYGERSRDYVIRAKRNGNGFKICEGFIRSDWLKSDAAVIDIQSGSFGCDKMSIEGATDGTLDVLALKLGNTFARNQCVITNLYTDHRMRNSKGDVVESRFRSGVTMIGCNLTGNIRAYRPLLAIGTVFNKGYRVVREGRWAAVSEITLGSRKAGIGDIAPKNDFKNLSNRFTEVTGPTVWPAFDQFSIFNVKLTSDVFVKPPSRTDKDRDAGRETKLIFSADDRDHQVMFDKSFRMEPIKVRANSKVVVEFMNDGESWFRSN